MKKIQVAVLSLIALIIIAASCSKNTGNDLSPQVREESESVTSSSVNNAEDENHVFTMEMPDNIASSIGGEDDDEPIIMHLALNIKGRPVAGTMVTFINGTDTLVKYANQCGETFFKLPRRGNWTVNVSQTGYIPIHNSVNVDHRRNLKINILKKQ